MNEVNIHTEKRNILRMDLAILLNYVFLNGIVLQIDACSKMLHLEPSKLYKWDNSHIPLPEKYRQMLGEEIDSIVEKEGSKHKTRNEKLQTKADLEDILGYGGNNPCIVLAILDANMTGMHIADPLSLELLL